MKEMPIIEVSKELKRELDKLSILNETHDFYKTTGTSGLDVELKRIIKENPDFFCYQSQVVMYLVSTKNYIEKPRPQYHVLYGLISKSYYVWFNETIPFRANVFIKTYDNKKGAQSHADELNEFVKEKPNGMD